MQRPGLEERVKELELELRERDDAFEESNRKWQAVAQDLQVRHTNILDMLIQPLMLLAMNRVCVCRLGSVTRRAEQRPQTTRRAEPCYCWVSHPPSLLVWCAWEDGQGTEEDDGLLRGQGRSWWGWWASRRRPPPSSQRWRGRGRREETSRRSSGRHAAIVMCMPPRGNGHGVCSRDGWGAFQSSLILHTRIDGRDILSCM